MEFSGRKITAIKKAAFLKSYSENGNITRSAALTQIERQSHYRWLKEDQVYQDAFYISQLQYADNLEAEARRRAHEGYEEAVYYKGDIVGQQRKFSDTLLIFLLKAAKPYRYKDRFKQ